MLSKAKKKKLKLQKLKYEGDCMMRLGWIELERINKKKFRNNKYCRENERE